MANISCAAAVGPPKRAAASEAAEGRFGMGYIRMYYKRAAAARAMTIIQYMYPIYHLYKVQIFYIFIRSFPRVQRKLSLDGTKC